MCSVRARRRCPVLSVAGIFVGERVLVGRWWVDGGLCFVWMVLLLRWSADTTVSSGPRFPISGPVSIAHTCLAVQEL